MAIGGNGKYCYSWGLNESGRLGLGLSAQNDYFTIIHKPRRIIFDNEQSNFQFISCGSLFSMAITEDGKCYCWGSQQSIPEQIHGPPLNKKIIKGSCGAYHCLVIDENGSCFGWGDNSCQQLGIPEIKNTKKPMEIKGPWNKSTCYGETGLLDVSCGNDHNLAIAKNGSIYGWGLNSDGQLNFLSCRELVEFPLEFSFL